MADFKLSWPSKVIVITAILASLLEIIDTSIVNVAIPTMMGNLGATLEDISWVVTGYIIANAIVLPIAGWLGMQIGRKVYYTGAILFFTATSVTCGLAPNLATLVVFRVFQGLAGGALLPTSQALIQEQFPREKAGMANAIYGMSVMIGPTIGPTLGGYLTDHFGWRMIFNINLPLGLVAAAMAYLYVGATPAYTGAKSAPPAQSPAAGVPGGAIPRAARTPIDFIGLALLTSGVGSLQFVLERGQADDWFDSGVIRLCTMIAAAALPTFVWWELKTKHPIVDLRLFKSLAVRYGTMLMMALGGMLYSLVFLIPIFAATLLNYTATQTGVLFIPGALLTAFCMPVVGALLKKHDPRILILFGITVVEISIFMMTKYNSLTSEERFFYPLLVRGLGMAFLFVPINTVVLSQFSGAQLGQVAGLMNLSRQIGGSIGIAGLSTLLQRNSAQNYIDLVSHVSLLNPNTLQAYNQSKAGLLGGKMAGAVGLTPSLGAMKALTFRVQKQVFALSYSQMMWVLLIGFGAALIPLALLKTTKKITGPIDAH